MSQPSSSNADLVRDGGRSGKSATAFRTISEVATDLDVAQHVLRFWESKFPQVRPLKRGGGRRYYRPEDVELLRQIRSFLYDEGYTIKGVQKLLKTKRGRDEAEPAVVTPMPLDDADHLVADGSPEDALRRLRRELSSLRDRLRGALD